ncbi:MAG: head-tail adaptor protein [Gemmatimonadaceae bacterium]|nr:head-tail adaptor protein [Gemmatimonadaceae bacterium]
MTDLPLSAADLALMRDTVADVTLAGTAVILTATKASDSQGGYAWTYAASGTADCHMSPEALRGDEAPVGGRLAEKSPWILTVPHDTTIDEDDRVTVESVTYEIIEVLSPRTWQLAKRVRCMEVD